MSTQGDTRLWHQITGQGADVVLLHGWSQNAAVWHSVVPALQHQYRINLIELPGHGASPMPYPADDLDAWVTAVLTVAPARATWVAWSLGGLIALRAAQVAPERIQRLCMVATAPCFIRSADWPHGIVANHFEQFAKMLIAAPESALRRFLTLQVRGSEGEKTVLREFITGLSQRPKARLEGLTAGLHLLLNTDLRDGLDQLTMPSAWLWGDRDTIATASMADDILSCTPQSTGTILNKAAHAPFISHFAPSMTWLEQALVH